MILMFPAAKVSKFFKMPNKLGKKKNIFCLSAQPEIRGAYVCALDASGMHIPLLCQPKMSRGACQCATGALAVGVAMLRDYRVEDRDFAK